MDVGFPVELVVVVSKSQIDVNTPRKLESEGTLCVSEKNARKTRPLLTSLSCTLS